jgi:hypothetical protein
MMFWTGLILGLFVGAGFGALMMAILASNKHK